jgi:hypothetical protein
MYFEVEVSLFNQVLTFIERNNNTELVNLTCVKAAETQAQQTINGRVGYRLGCHALRNLDGLAANRSSANGDNVGTDSSKYTTPMLVLDRPRVAAQLVPIW